MNMPPVKILKTVPCACIKEIVFNEIFHAYNINAKETF